MTLVWTLKASHRLQRREYVAGINRESIGESMANQLGELEDKDKSKRTKTMLKILVSPPCPSAPILSPPSFPSASIGNPVTLSLVAINPVVDQVRSRWIPDWSIRGRREDGAPGYDLKGVLILNYRFAIDSQLTPRSIH